MSSRTLLLCALFTVCALSQMTFTDNWQKRAYSPNVYKAIGNSEKQSDRSLDCDPEQVLERVRELQRLQLELQTLTEEVHVCAVRYTSPPLYARNALYRFPTYKQNKNEPKL